MPTLPVAPPLPLGESSAAPTAPSTPLPPEEEGKPIILEERRGLGLAQRQLGQHFPPQNCSDHRPEP